MPARPRGLLEPCAATSGPHGSEEGGAGKRHLLSDAHHHIRDLTYDEDRSQPRTGSTPQILAGLHNLAIGALRTTGRTNIASSLRWISRNPTRALLILGQPA